VLHLEFGEPDFPTPLHIVEAGQRSLRDERQGYGPGAGLPELRAAIAARMQRVDGLDTTPERVVASAGGTGGASGGVPCPSAPRPRWGALPRGAGGLGRADGALPVARRAGRAACPRRARAGAPAAPPRAPGHPPLQPRRRGLPPPDRRAARHARRTP